MFENISVEMRGSIGELRLASDIVTSAKTATLEYRPERSAVVVDMDPVAYIHAISVYRQWHVAHGADDHQRDELFGVLKRTVVVRATRDDGGETELRTIRPNQ